MGLFQSQQKRVCAFCRSTRTVYMKKGIGISDAFTALLMAFTITYIFWQNLNPKVIVIFGCLLIVMEIVILTRHRLSVVCRYCGFDPHVYLKKPEKAADLVKLRVEELRQSPDALLSRRSFEVLKKFQQTSSRDTKSPAVSDSSATEKNRIHMKV